MAQPKPSGLSIVNSQWEFVADFKSHRISAKENIATDTNTYAITFKQALLQKQTIFKSSSLASSSSLFLTAKHPIILGQEGYRPSGSVPAHCKATFMWTTLLPSAIYSVAGREQRAEAGLPFSLDADWSVIGQVRIPECTLRILWDIPPCSKTSLKPLREPQRGQEWNSRPEVDSEQTCQGSCPAPDAPRWSSEDQSSPRTCVMNSRFLPSRHHWAAKMPNVTAKRRRMEVKGLHLSSILTLPDKPLIFPNM